MNDLKELGKLMKEHPIIIVVTLAAMAVGAIFGAVAFYQGWLGWRKQQIKEVEVYAFADCSSLERITLHSVKLIGKGAFSNCKNLKEICIPKIEKIEDIAFEKCTELQRIQISDTINSIGNHIFKDCTKLAVCIIKKEQEYLLNEMSFAGCKKEKR